MRQKSVGLILATLALTACNSGSSSSSNPPVATIQYATLTGYSGGIANSATVVTGIRGVESSTNVYISGIYSESVNQGLLYVGPLSASGGSWNVLNYPSSSGVTVTSTALYGPNNGTAAGTIQIVGNYTTVESGSSALGLLYQGTPAGVGTWQTLLPPSPDGSTVINTIAHSTMGGLVVGNYDTRLATGKAFIYDINQNTYYNLTKPNAVSITAYGIWYNGGHSYTIAGGYSNANIRGLSIGYLVDWNSLTNTTSNWTSFNYMNQPVDSIITHFEGITSDGQSGYNLAADYALASTMSSSGIGSSFVHIPRNIDGSFGQAEWTSISYPGSAIMSANTVFESTVLGVYVLPNSSQVYSYMATLP
jgi:hypothetical protein